MPSLCLISEYGTVNGGEKSLLAVVPHLVEQGWHCTVWLPERSEFAKELRKIGVECQGLEFHDSYGVRKPIEVIREIVSRQVRTSSHDLFHANTLSTARTVAPVLRFLERAGSGHLRDIIKLSCQAVDDLNQMDRLIAVSQATADFHTAQQVHEERLRVIHNGVDLVAFQPRQATGYVHRELDLPADSILLLSVGQIGLRKGLETTLQAMHRIVNQHRRCHLLVVGQRYSQKQESVEYECQLRIQATSNGLKGHVHWLGHRRDVHRLMNECQLLLHAARQEPLGRVILESIASGLPAICTSVGGTCEILPPDRFPQLLCDVDDADEMARRALDLLQHDRRRVGIAEALREHAVVNFSAQQSAGALDACLRGVIQAG